MENQPNEQVNKNETSVPYMSFDKFYKAFAEYEAFMPESTHHLMQKLYTWYVTGFKFGYNTKSNEIIKLLNLKEAK